MTTRRPMQILARAQVPSANGRPIRKDEIELHERGIYIESWLPERRSRRKPLLFVHGELTGSWLWERYLAYFASRGWEGHALNLQNHFWSRTVDPAELTFESYVATSRGLQRLGPTTVVIGHGLGGLLALKAAEQAPIGGLVLMRPEPPGARSGRPPVASSCATSPRCYGRADRLVDPAREAPTRLSRSHDRRRPADPAPPRPEAARERARSADRAAGVTVDPAPYAEIPRLVIGAGLDRFVTEPVAEQVAEWLGADYEPFGAHSHYGLIVGEQSHQQVADAIRGFLEANRL